MKVKKMVGQNIFLSVKKYLITKLFQGKFIRLNNLQTTH
jgi:hypothetical protein